MKRIGAVWRPRSVPSGLATLVDSGRGCVFYVTRVLKVWGTEKVAVSTGVVADRASKTEAALTILIAYPDKGHYLAKEGSTANDYYEDDVPVRIELYLDYRDRTLDNFPPIALCDECAEDLGGDVGELTELEAGQAAVC